MLADELFELLDLNHDGGVSRSELHTAAEKLGWHWHEAPLFALLDLLTIQNPIPRKQFTAIVNQIEKDPMGPYGNVLLKSPHFSEKSPPEIETLPPRYPLEAVTTTNSKIIRENDLIAAIEKTAGKDIATGYQSLINALETYRISIDNGALLIIDPQRAFTEGVWMQSIGDGAAIDVEPLIIAFNNCADILNVYYGRMEIMFTRCPFPPGSYGWDDSLDGVISNRQHYFIKPGNSVLFPPLNGFKEWVERCIESGKNTLVLGGCTLNSCVRVSSIDTLTFFKDMDLEVVVDLGICGARLRNFSPSAMYGGMSAVSSALRQMAAAGIRVVRRVEWI